MVIAHVGFALCAAILFPSPDRNNAVPLACTIGVQTGYFVLLGYWFALSQPRLSLRLVICFTVLLAVTFTFGCYVVRTSGPESVIFVMACACSIQWLLAVVPGWLMRRAGWLLQTRFDVTRTPAPKQFHVRHLLVWTTGLAVLFDIARVAIQPLRIWIESLESQGFSFSGFFAILVLGHAVMGGPLMCAVMSREGWYAWAGIALFALCSSTYVEHLFLKDTMVNQAMLQNTASFVVVVTICFALTFVSLLLLVRFRGWALVHLSSGI